MKAMTSRVLVLNATFEPLYFCTGRRALVLVLAGRAETVEPSRHVIASPDRLFEVPAVVRLHRLVRWQNRFRVVYNKRNILKRDDHHCQYCGRTGREMTLDHVIPLSRGGADDWHNVVTACRECNRRKGSRTPEEAGLALARRPRRPHYLFLFLANDYADPATACLWGKYLPTEPRGSLIQ